MSLGLAPWLTRGGPLPPAGSPVATLVHRAHVALASDLALARLLAGLPRLLAQLGRRRARRRVTGPTVRGPIDWPATIRARHAAGGAPQALVSRTSDRDLDVRENQLLAVVLARYRELLDQLPPTVQAGTLVVSAGTVSATPVAARVRELVALLDDPQLRHRLAAIGRPARLDRRWPDACRASDVREYGLVADAWDAWTGAAVGCDPLAAPASFVILPADPDAPEAAPWMQLAARRLTRPRKRR